MNLISAIKLYIEKMCNESGPGMKIILLDKETVSCIEEKTRLTHNMIPYHLLMFYFILLYLDKYYFNGI